MILSVDPGEVRIGFCLFKYDEETKRADLRIKQILNGPSDLYNLLRVAWQLSESSTDKIQTVVCENYRTRPEQNPNPRGRSPYGRSQSGGYLSVKDFWSEQLTVRVIGACEMFAQWVGAEFVTQEPKILAMGRKWCDFPISKNPNSHIPDDISAYIHGAKYMMDKRMIRGVEDILKFGQETIV